ncbi:acetyl-CoA hydrolase/transferase family protein [Sphingobium sp. CAP-1]|uniref:acetyl-CoA hydrolase/transferase family protein n=1 Tax=Sphingobium sp. CAP-1 TaxID=2676077 RepID=UPI0012BB3E52|nr:acetyl-CoA hydrolase/transferase C-terminal domain-containing protein [Sphingobium sp. CAP-1]QGP79917.1 4-hydroxybutyrate--acetyl-CoA CoA transferase [Sphingobium sp. CAP-1]
MTIDTLYQARRMTADQAVALIPNGAKIATGLAVAFPPALGAALADRVRAGALRDATLYAMLAPAASAAALLSPDLSDRIRQVSLFHGGIERANDALLAGTARALTELLPVPFHQIPRALTEHIGVDTFITTVSPMDANGRFSLGTDADYALAVARSGARLIVEVNPAMPYVHGDCMIHVADVAALVEHHVPLCQIPSLPRNATDDAIGAIIAAMVEDGACLQMGIGAVPDAVCAALMGHRRLGIHTELLSPGLVSLIRAGVVDNSAKTLHPGQSIFTFAMGDQSLYDFIHDNPAVAAHPVDYVNAPHIIARNDRMISVNATLQIDLGGACNSEFMGGRQYSGTGGQLDFVRGAYASAGGRSIIACHSTAARGTISRIVPWLDGPVTTPRTDTHIIVTEFGSADMKGKSLTERARALITIAHPAFRDDLERAARERRVL